MYNIFTTLLTLAQHCMNVIQMFCVCWDGIADPIVAFVRKDGYMEAKRNKNVTVLKCIALPSLALPIALAHAIALVALENPCRVLLGLHGNSTERFILKNLCRLESMFWQC